MTPISGELERLAFLKRVISRESHHLGMTDGRLFAVPLTPSLLSTFATDIALSECADAFASRFGRLQDNLADKLLPALLSLSGEPVRSAIDNLDKAERLGWIVSVDDWLTMRKLRNQMVHEYIEDTQILCDALNAGHNFVPVLQNSARAIDQAVDSVLNRFRSR
ncbi:MAG: hypothetical protein ACI9W6_002990 [Motiliproteus sp.]|jgi:hypothetical protein